MRTLLLILVPMALLGGGFYFLLMQDRPPMYVGPPATLPSIARASATPDAATPGDPQQPILKQSTGVFVESRNRSGRLTNDFRAQRFDPREDGDVDVIFPEARFYGENGSLVTLEGSGGRVAVSQTGDRSDPKALGSATPTSGELKDVTIRFYERQGDAEATLTASVPAVRFDAISNRVSTVDSLIDGKGVMAEQVPVSVRGRDFELDGQGLIIRWNDREGRLEQLEIHRGERLLVTDPDRFGGTGLASEPSRRSPRAIPTAAFAVLGLVQAGGGATTAGAATSRAATSRDLYHATFDRDVRVTRGGVALAAADVMRVVLPLGDTNGKSSQPSTRRAIPAPATTRGARSTVAVTTAANARAVEIRWSGKLTLRPAASVPDAPGEQMVELAGAPAWVSENGGRVEARLIRAETDSGSVRVEPGGRVDSIVVRDASGTELRSRSPLVVDRQSGVATVDGGGSLVMPGSQPDASPTNVSWSRNLTLTLWDGDDASLREITIDGEADVESDSMKLGCEKLRLGFDRPATPARSTAPNQRFAVPATDASLLRTVDAQGAARMELGKGDAVRHLGADRIELGLIASSTTSGRPATSVTTILCNGSVALTDSLGLDLTCGSLDVRTRPMALEDAPASNESPLDSIIALVATERVRLKQADGSRASGDRVELSTLESTEGTPAKRMVLVGQPASVAGERGSLEGTRITLDPQTGDVSVPGPGKFIGADPKQPRNTMAIAWADSMDANGETGVCNLNGGVSIDGANADGTSLVATAKRGVIEFTTRRATPSTRPTTAPAMAGVTLDSIRALRLAEDVDVAMNAADVRTSSVQTQLLNVDMEAGTVSAPREGRMLLIDARAGRAGPTTRETSPATRPTSPASPTKMGPGTLALAWQDDLLWTLRDGSLVMNGAVRMGFERQGTEDPVRLSCDRVVCSLTPIPMAKGIEQMSQRVELRTVTAERNVSVRSKLASFDSAALSFDAVTNRATATGTPETAVSVYDDNGAAHVGFSAVTWNLETGQIEDFRNIDGRLRR